MEKLYASKIFFLKMAGGRMHNPHSTPLDRVALNTVWDRVGSYGIVWDRMRPYGHLWDRMGSY